MKHVAIRAFWVAAVLVPAIAILSIVQQTVGTDDAQSAAVPPCRVLNLDEPGDRVTCRTESATLTIAGEDEPVLLPGTAVRVLSSELDGRMLRVKLRVRNETQTPPAVAVGRGQLYVNVGGQRVELAPLVGDGRPEDDSKEVNARFRLPERSATALRDGDATADLGIVPWEHLDEERPPHLGVVRLDV